MGDNPKWLKRRVRARMAETGEKYTTALRAVQKELDQREPGEAFCGTCPDHEACMQGAPCDFVKAANGR